MERRPKRKAAEDALAAMKQVRVHETVSADDYGVVAIKNILDNSAASKPCFTSKIVAFPDELGLVVFGYLPKRDLVHCVSVVSKPWLAATQNPHLWMALQRDVWKVDAIELRHRFFLFRPQFSSLKKLVLPEISPAVLCSLLDRIVEAIGPQLEELGLAFDFSFDKELHQIPALFPKLKKLDLTFQSAHDRSLVPFIQAMGNRLESLVIDVLVNHFCSDTILKALAHACYNLECFLYNHRGFTGFADSSFTTQGVVDVLRNCPKIEVCEVRANKSVVVGV